MNMELLEAHIRESKQTQLATWSTTSSVLATATTSTLTAATPINLILVEGFLLLHTPRFASLFDLIIFLNIDMQSAKNRRLVRDAWLRTIPHHFDNEIWPAYVQHHQWLLQHRSSIQATTTKPSVPLDVSIVDQWQAIRSKVHVIDATLASSDIVQRIETILGLSPISESLQPPSEQAAAATTTTAAAAATTTTTTTFT
jgi:hypothetical protein